jgi:hypothetical protein
MLRVLRRKDAYLDNQPDTLLLRLRYPVWAALVPPNPRAGGPGSVTDAPGPHLFPAYCVAAPIDTPNDTIKHSLLRDSKFCSDCRLDVGNALPTSGYRPSSLSVHRSVATPFPLD